MGGIGVIGVKKKNDCVRNTLRNGCKGSAIQLENTIGVRSGLDTIRGVAVVVPGFVISRLYLRTFRAEWIRESAPRVNQPSI